MQENTTLTVEQIAENKNRFITLLSGVKRAGCDKLIEWLESTDFFQAPASTRFHENYAGGLCEHSLCVYDKLTQLNASDAVPQEMKMTEEQMVICALLHDVCKTNFYKPGYRNVKNDATNRWERVQVYTVEDSFAYGHGEKSVYMVERFMRLKPSEAIAIRWHMGGFDEAVRGGSYSLSNAWNQYPSGALLHAADLLATYAKA